MPKNTNDLSDKKVTSKSSIDKSKKVLDKSTAVASKKATTTAKKSSKKASAPKKSASTTSAVKKTTEKATTKKSVAEKTAVKPATKPSTAKNTTAKVATKKTTAKKAVTKTTNSATNKASGAKKTTSKTAKKTASKKTSVTKTKKPTKKVEILEYYDLPYRYNQTIVKILAQTPTTLFVYWDISDTDRKKYIDEFGENFFENTVPVLIVHNKTMNYSFEIEVNDFANSWYFNVHDAKCEYEIELGRRPKQNQISLPNNYIYVTSSNIIEAPNNHILFEKNQKVLFFRNVKTNTTVSKDVSTFEFMKYAGKIHNIYNVYKEIYKHDELENLEKLSSSNF